MADDGPSNQKSDARFDHIKDRIASGFPKLAGAKLDKLLLTDEIREIIVHFCDDDQKRCLVVPESMKIDLVIPSKSTKGKVLLFVKLQNCTLTMENIHKEIAVLELGSNPFEHLELLANEIFLPVLSNPQNQAKWGEVPTREIMDRFHNFLSSTTILCGQIKGETRLPMPPIDLSGGPSTGKNRISLLEGAIITWTKQIRSVLKQDPESQLKQGMHPTPDVEIDFWRNKASNLNSIFEQLQGPRIRRVLRALDQSKSTYCTTFARLCREVFTARTEANDNTKYLRTLEYWFQSLNGEDDFPKTVELFKPMLHIILLIWKNSKHYNIPARLVVLMREICNSLIKQATKYVSGEQIFTMIESEEANLAVTMLKTTLSVCGAFKSTYFDYKTTANAECPANPWKIQNNALFMRLDSFLERCHDILDLTQTIVQFTKLAKIEVGGTKGKTLTASIKQIYEDFHHAVAKFKAVPYDIMDVGAKAFDDDFYEFRCSIKELERRLGAVVSLAFDDCSNVYGRFKLLDSFEGLLERPIIQDELEKKYIGLVQSYGQDLKTVQELFLHYRDQCPIAWNLPPIAGALTWCRGLVERIEIPYVKLNQLDRAILEREEAKEVSKVFMTIKASLQEFESQKIEEWGRDVEQSSHSKLKLPLLIRNPESRLLTVNFDPALVRLLREVKYFLLLGLNVPDTALDIYQQVETFRAWTGNLDLIVNMNNDVLNILLPVERPLALPYLNKFDAMIEKGLSTMNWKSNGITEFIADSMEQVQAVSEVMRTMKNNLKGINEQLMQYTKPLIVRKSKPVAKDEFEKDHKNFVKERYAEIKEGGKNIHTMVKDTNKVLRVSNASNDWRAYVDFVNNVVVDGLAKVVYNSLDFLYEQLDPAIIAKEDKMPLIEVKLDLVSVRVGDDERHDEVRFLPDLKESGGKGVRDLVNSWIGSFFNVATLFKRLDNEGTYLREIHSDQSVKMLLAIINETLEKNEEACNAVRTKYEAFSYLWLTDLNAHFATFLADAQYTSPNGQQLLDLNKFTAAICKYEGIRDQINQFQSPMDVGWLRINTQPIKSQLMTWTSKWIDLYMRHLKKTINEKLTALDKFMSQVTVGLDVEVEPDTEAGKKALMAVMEDIRDVRKAIEVNQEIFKPLQESLNILKAHGTDIVLLEKIGGKLVQDYLDEAPLAWDSVVKKTFRKKEEILPMQLLENDKIKEELEAFFLSVRDFRGKFRAEAPFTFTGDPKIAYQELDRHAHELDIKEKEAKRFNELEELFELQVSKYAEMGDTRTELRSLKQVWDMKAQIQFTYSSWNGQLWNDIKTDDLEDVNKILLKNLRKMGTDTPVMKGWTAYRSIEDTIKNMSVVLPLINELHSPAMRDRHWKSLAKVCGVKAIDPNDPKFTFEDTVALKVHEHVEDVEEIVETANKELKIERKLRDIENIWRTMTLEYVPHNDTEMFLVKLSEEVIENLESHQLELQTMIGMGKFVDFFRDRVLHWQGTLGSMEDVLKVWVNVTRSWTALESIFLASADIRSQLPDDTKRFEGIDSEFKELMKDAVTVPICTEVCLVEGRQELLASMMARLDQCQKSLNEYLDQKKKIFPRFYFVSNVALLDMLANGTNPPKIMKYLGDCYDSLDELVFVTDAEGVPNTKLANEMVAKDKERLMLSEPFHLEGEVERYLNNLTEAMKMTLKLKMQDGYVTAGNWEVDKPRQEWLFYYPAQVVVTTTQVYWTEETETALEDLSGGQEDAVKRYLQLCDLRLQELIKLVLGKLKSGDRVKIITIITLDVHARDVIQRLIDEKVEGLEAFLWQQQLRFYWLSSTMDTEIRICDFRTRYFYEWIGNTGRLVITPLTDRCYVTLTMGLRLFLGGAPAGPAGTGKTETTKDLARALALPCYVFNCSDQMNYQTMADIFRGLAQTGTWGCFDEFNRISIEVLSVVATQVKTVQDCIKKLAIVSNREPEYQHLPPGLPPTTVGHFMFEGDMISLCPTCGFFITMNPGYAGRTELPENLKVLFRSCAMIRPDLKLICENMLMSEGFQGARVLSIKFVTLYELSSELLSKQAHYDWGLRAVKSVLRVAGGLKRGEPEKSEDELLMRALRDFNTPKIPAQDTPIFLRLIADLFMGLEAHLKVNDKLKEVVKIVTKEDKLQPDEAFVLKVLQFQELLDVRHSVMLLGPTGCGKSTIWRTLVNTHNWDMEKMAYKTKRTCTFETVNPKSVTGDELYGYMTLSKDWKDGVLSIIMRGMAKNVAEQGFHDHQTYKWVVLDGDIDAVWIESMNTVMDDNKVLTLVSNERIPLSDAMRMVFEIHTLKNATPATVSRAGILYINDTDVGFQPYIDSWMGCRTNEIEKSYLPYLINRYLSKVIEFVVASKLQMVVPLPLINLVQSFCFLLDGMLRTLPSDRDQQAMERVFLYCLMWAFGGALSADKQIDYKKQFNAFFRTLNKTLKFPEAGTVMDYFIDPLNGDVVPWQSKVESFQSGADTSSSSHIVVPTADTVRLTYLMNYLVRNGRPVMFVGSAGTGKTVLVKDFLDSLAATEDTFKSVTINMNFYTDSLALQNQLEQNIDKRSGKSYGPPSGKLIYFVDDLNLPFVETYGTQTPIALMRQHVDHCSWFDRTDLSLKKQIVDAQYVACMNHKSGSFLIDPRLQRHFVTFACQMPSEQDLATIFGTILNAHLYNFDKSIVSRAKNITDATITLHKEISTKFLPSAIKFHYNFTMRDLSAVFKGLLNSRPAEQKTAAQMTRLWYHEVMRVFSDRLISEVEVLRCRDVIVNVGKRFMEDDAEVVFADPCTFTSFVSANNSDEIGNYKVSDDFALLKKSLERKLAEYNETNAIMNLVLFEQAVRHVTRITRILMFPGGNALLVGVGGSGKQSLSKLAAHICNYQTSQISVTSDYGVNDLKEHLRDLYRKAGVKPGEPLVFLLTDSQITDERFLVYINDLLSSGRIPDLFTKEDYDGIFASIRNVAKSEGVPDNRESMMDFFINRVRANLHIVLCFSPVGDTFRQRARKFPGIINCTAIDWFHEWPREALVSVAQRFLEDIETGGRPEVRDNIAYHIAEVHTSVGVASLEYLKKEKRYNYVTPKSFLELISFYKSLLNARRNEMFANIKRLDTGLQTLMRTNQDVEQLQEFLKEKKKEVEAKKAATDKLLEEMGKQRSEAEAQQQIADVEKKKADEAANEARILEEQAAGDLAIASPALEAANNAVKCLDKNSLTELKSFSKPPAGVDKVTTALLIMIKGEKKDFSWENAKKMMAKVDAFKEKLEKYRGEDIPEEVISKVLPMLDDPEFTFEKMKAKSAAAANLANWVINIIQYNGIYKRVKPLMESLDGATRAKRKAEDDLAVVKEKLTAIEVKLATLQGEFKEATQEKARVEQEAKDCLDRLSLAERLTTGLASEKDRWGLTVEGLRSQEFTLAGDVMLAAAFTSYIGAFGAEFRSTLWKDMWVPDLVGRDIPITPGVDPLSVLANDSLCAEWQNEGLPADRISLENGAIISNCSRWPLLIDPQLQGIRWLKRHEENRVTKTGRKVVIMKIGEKQWMNKIVHAIQAGDTVILESIGENLDASLDSVLTKAVFRKGRTMYLKVGDEDVEYDDNFRLYMQTKLSNPHYKPEISAQCTIINFIVTRKGLEDQLLATIVSAEQPELEETRNTLVAAFNTYKIQLKDLEDQLLERLANAPVDILSDIPLIEGLEQTKQTATEINDAVTRGIQTEIGINQAREVYRGVAVEASLLYFVLLQLCNVDHMYQYSLDSFTMFFLKALKIAPGDPVSSEANERVASLQTTLRWTIFKWVVRGLFEKHRLIFMTQLVLSLMQQGIIGEESGFTPEGLRFLLFGAKVGEEKTQISWVTDMMWNGVKTLSYIDGFEKLPSDMEENSARFLEWFQHFTPESERLPGAWRELDRAPFKKLMVVRVLRPDRITAALSNFIRDILPRGKEFVECDSELNSFQILEQSFEDSSPMIPLYFILSPGADVVSDVDKLAAKLGKQKGVEYHNISLGQGQDIVAEEKLDVGNRQGHWVFLNNVHLMPRWLTRLEKKMEEYALMGTHPDFRIFFSSDPSNSIPVSILDRCIKITSDPPSGLKANLKQAFACFSRETYEELESRTKGILFGLCQFHAVMVERKKFGAKGYNMMYPFSVGDLICSASVLRNYMESAPPKVPWADLRYLFGEIMYGGHIVNDFDRLLATTYLEFYMKDELLEEMPMYPYIDTATVTDVFKAPSTSSNYDSVVEHVDEELKGETPLAFGLHPNAEIGFRTQTSEELLRIVLELSAAAGDGAGGEGQDSQQIAEAVIQDVMETLRDVKYETDAIASGLDDIGPFQNVILQECERMNSLVGEVVRSLAELDLGFKGDLTVSDAMEELANSLYLDRVPKRWELLAYPSQRSLSAWVADLVNRIAQLNDWVASPLDMPVVTWLPGLFNPPSFLTAVMQIVAQAQSLELDKLTLVTDMTKKLAPEEFTAAAKDGTYISGLYLEGGSWNLNAALLESSKPREMFSPLPVINIRPAIVDKFEPGTFLCPVYKTQQRGPTYVFSLQLKTKADPGKWVLAGVVSIMDIL